MAPILVDKDGVSIHIRSREHLPPHVHVFTGDDAALVDIRTGEMFKGYVPPKKLKIAQEWLAEENHREIVEENFYELNPKLRPAQAIEQEEKKEKKQVAKKAVKISKPKKKGGK